MDPLLVPASPAPPRYSLCPKNKGLAPDAIGLDLDLVPSLHKLSRGRPSWLSKARHAADAEVSIGRKQIIVRALRALKGPISHPT